MKKSQFTDSDEVDDLRWYKIDEVEAVIARENNCSGMHFDKCKQFFEIHIPAHIRKINRMRTEEEIIQKVLEVAQKDDAVRAVIRTDLKPVQKFLYKYAFSFIVNDSKII